MTTWMKRLMGIFSDYLREDAWRLTRLIKMAHSGDPAALESARSTVQRQDVEPLIALYWKSEEWSQKQAVVELLQDQHHEKLREMMLDFLRAPVTPGDEGIQLAQAIALGFVDEEYDCFTRYYNDRKLLARDVQTVLHEHGLQADPSPQPEQRSQPRFKTVDSNAPPEQRLLEGAEHGDLTVVKQALAEGAHIDTMHREGNYYGCSALIMALMYQRYEVGTYLIDHGADVNYRRVNKYRPDPLRGQTPLWWAANHGHLPMARRLLQVGAEVNTPDHHGSTPLVKAAGSGHVEMVRLLVENGADLNARIYDGRTALNLAATHGRTAVMEYFLTLGCDPDETGAGFTPLMITADNNFYEMAKLLIRAGADVNATHPGKGNYMGLRGWTPLVFAVKAGLIRMTKLLIEAGADVNYRVPAGQNGRGDWVPERRVSDFAQGKRAERILELLEA
jgi:ankyrin repeat protein